MDIFKGEYKIRSIGGKLEKDYLYFRRSVLFVNANLIPIFFMLGFYNPEDKDSIIDILLYSENFASGVKKLYMTREKERIAMGEAKLERYLSSKIIERKFDRSEERERYLRCQLNRFLTIRFKYLFERYTNMYKPTFEGYSRTPFLICRESLYISPLGFEIDIDRYLDIYRSHFEAGESCTKKQHQEAADAINRFFNGSMAITQKELARYFIIDCGIVKPNPESITIDDYIRLGCRGLDKSK